LSKGLLTKVGAALLVLLLATFSTARAHQVWSTQQAQATVKSARAEAEAAFTRARTAGLTARELAAPRQQISALAAQDPPAGSPIWNPSAPDFYAQQRQQYQDIASGLRHQVTATRVAAHRALASDVAALSAIVATAASLDVPFDSASGALSSARTTQSAPGAGIAKLRAAAAAVSTAVRTLKSAVSARQTQLASIEHAAHDDLPTLIAQAKAAASTGAARRQLAQLVKPKDAALATSLQSALSAVTSATTLNGAALAALHFNDTLAAANAAVAKDLPAEMVVVSTENQEATMYENGKVVDSTPVTTGGPELPTFHGVFHIYDKISPFVFHSPFPVGSPYYYDPTPIEYWMPFDGQQGLHDAPWRPNFGPGSNFAPTDLGNGNTILGTHGCVNLPSEAAAFLWNWAPIGTTVVVN
jgi:lipoprotein-anchoring transpeptidase ErfK/SrfK